MKISVIIPAYNEEKYISKVIRLVKKCKCADEIIVVDNNSTDNTSKIAKKSGAITVFCKEQGKGYAMEKGIATATGDVFVFLDGDICNYKDNFINMLIDPIINNNADFVKATFDRSGGRVTELVAKPLLEILFPYLGHFQQPLSGIIAGKKEVFKKLVLDKDYGVDIGLLIDVYKENATIKEVNIGKIKNYSQDWHNLIDMSKQVSTAILKRADYSIEKR